MFKQTIEMLPMGIELTVLQHSIIYFLLFISIDLLNCFEICAVLVDLRLFEL